MRKKYIVKIKVRNCDVIFGEGMEPGILGYEEMIYDLPEKDFSSPMITKQLMEVREYLLQELLLSEVEVIDEE